MFGGLGLGGFGLTRGGGAVQFSMASFPAGTALYDMDFVTPQHFGGTIPAGSNSGTLLRQQIVNTQPSYMENADGSMSTFSVTSSVRRTSKGLVSDGQSRTNKVKAKRDLTNVNWTASGITPLKNMTGRTNVANSASRITATAPNGTILNSYVLAATQDMNAFFDAKRITGTGTLEWTYDNSTWTAVDIDAGVPVFGGWARYQVPTQAAMVANTYSLGFRIATSGDAFGIDFVDANEIAVEYSPISVTTTGSDKGWFDRPSAYDTFSSPLQVYLDTAPVRCIYAEFAFRRAGGIVTASGGTILNVRLTDMQAFGGVVTTGNAPIIATSPRLVQLNKVIAWQTATQTGICLNGGAIVTASGAAPSAGDHWDLLTNGSASASIDGRCTRLIFFSAVPTNAQIIAATT